VYGIARANKAITFASVAGRSQAPTAYGDVKFL